jgi:EmrB/QacA subfamily drug resistance transporter
MSTTPSASSSAASASADAFQLPSGSASDAERGAAAGAPAKPIDRDALRTAIAVLVGGIAVILDATIVTIALRDLATDLGSDISTVQWVATAYLLALGVVIPTVGWLQSRLGAKRLWLACLALFMLGSVLCACAWDASSLIAFRVVQGLGGGMMVPLMTTMIMQSTAEADRHRLMAVIAIPMAVGPILGPVIGGFLLTAGSWHWLFLINVPLCATGLVLAWRMIPTDQPTRRERLDVVGLLLLSPALVTLLWGLSNVSDAGGFRNTNAWAPIALGAALTIAFVIWALHRRSAAIVDLEVLRCRPTWAATALMFLSGAALYGAMLLLPLYWQEIRGADALDAGLNLIPQGVGAVVARGIAIRFLDRISPRGVSVLGFVLAAAATVPFAYADAGTANWILLATLFVRGLGVGIVVIPMMTVAFIGLDREKVPHASIVTRIAQQVGGSVGVALLAVILATSTENSGSLATGFNTAFWWAVGFTGVAIVVSLVLPGRVQPSSRR